MHGTAERADNNVLEHIGMNIIFMIRVLCSVSLSRRTYPDLLLLAPPPPKMAAQGQPPERLAYLVHRDSIADRLF